MKARLATIVTLLALVGGTGGALAIASGGGGTQVTSAAVSEYSHPCTIDGHHYQNCPKRYPHHFHCYFQGKYYNRCPYGKAVKGVHAVRHRRHKPAFTG